MFSKRTIITVTAVILLLMSVAAAIAENAMKQDAEDPGVSSETTERGETAEQLGTMTVTEVTYSEGELSTLVRDSVATYNAISEQIPQNVISESKCVAIFPSITRVALLVGARHGDGVVTCKGVESTDWSRLGFIDLIGASFGAQLGAKSSPLIVFFMNDKAREGLSKGNLSFGADISVSVGTLDKEAVVDYSRYDAFAYTTEDTSGLFAGAALNGVVMRLDADELRTFYKEDVAVSQVLTTLYTESDPQSVADLVRQLPSGNKGARARLSDGASESETDLE